MRATYIGAQSRGGTILLMFPEGVDYVDDAEGDGTISKDKEN